MNPKHTIHARSRSRRFLAFGAAPLLALTLSASGATLALVNGGFDTGTAGSSSIAGWTTTAGATGFWLASTSAEAPVPESGALYLSANRQVGGAASQPLSSTLSQMVALDPTNLALVAGGSAQINLAFYYADYDPADEGRVTLTFLDSSLATIGTPLTTGVLAGGSIGGSGWMAAGINNGAVPLGTESVRIDIITQRIVSTTSITNLAFDSFSAEIIPEPSTALLGGLGLLGLLRRRR